MDVTIFFNFSHFFSILFYPVQELPSQYLALCALALPTSVSKVDPVAESDVAWMKSVIVAVRIIRGEMNLPPGKAIPLFLSGGDTSDEQRLSRLENFIVPLAKLSEVLFVDKEKIPASSTQLIGQLAVHVPIAGLINVEAEVERLEKQIKKLVSDIKIILCCSAVISYGNGHCLCSR